MRADLSIISGRGLRPWPDSYNPKRYYVDFWRKKFLDDIERYNAKYSVHRRQDEISIYFDTDGFLHIVCMDQALAARIDRYFQNWYDYVCREKFDESIQHCHVGLMIEPYCTDLKDGFVQLKYGGMVCNLSPDQLRHVRDIRVQVGEFKGQTITGAETGIPRLDTILHRMLEDGEVWPYGGRFFEEKLDELGIPRVFATAPFWWTAYYTLDTRFWSI